MIMKKINVIKLSFGIAKRELTQWAFLLNKPAVRLRLSSEPVKEEREREKTDNNINMGSFFTLVSSH